MVEIGSFGNLVVVAPKTSLEKSLDVLPLLADVLFVVLDFIVLVDEVDKEDNASFSDASPGEDNFVSKKFVFEKGKVWVVQ